MSALSRQVRANAVALLALFVALSGSAYAAAKIDGRELKRHTVTGSKLRANTLTGAQVAERKLGPVPKAKAADTATSALRAGDAVAATQAENADHADEADAATYGRLPAVYAHLGPTGSVDAARSRTVAQANVVADPGGQAGVYCLKGLRLTPRGATATPEATGAAAGAAVAQVRVGAGGPCAGVAATQLQVTTQALKTGTPTDAGFFLTVY